MRLGKLVGIGGLLGIGGVALACSSSSAPPDTPGASNPATATANTCLGKAGLAFDVPACNTCMSDSPGCCDATVACFKGDADCAALHSCMQACEAAADTDGGGGGNGMGDGGGNGMGGGGGGVGGGGGDGGGSGGDCKAACTAQHPNVVAKWQTYNNCSAGTCKTQCL